MRGARGRRQRL